MPHNIRNSNRNTTRKHISKTRQTRRSELLSVLMPLTRAFHFFNFLRNLIFYNDVSGHSSQKNAFDRNSPLALNIRLKITSKIALILCSLLFKITLDQIFKTSKNAKKTKSDILGSDFDEQICYSQHSMTLIPNFNTRRPEMP